MRNSKSEVNTTLRVRNSKLLIKLLLGLLVVAVGANLLLFSLLLDIEVKPSERMLRLFGGATPAPEVTDAQALASQVVPEEGYTVNIRWGDTGVKLVETGGIDITKYRENYAGQQYEELLSYLTEPKDAGITINRRNAYFWVNTLWALGLTQKSDVLEKGIMGTEYKKDLGNFASTGGWTLGAQDAVKLYSSAEIISLSAEQQEMVSKISSNVYRPCCGNPTSFPDCNHGMAALGLVELMVSQGFSEDEIYKAVLAFNSYWFENTYVDLAYFFKTKENTDWKDVDPKRVLSAEFSSALGYGAVKEQIGNIPGAPKTGASCGA